MTDALKVRSEWMLALNAETQRFACSASFDAWRTRTEIGCFLAALPEASNPAEQVILRGLLFKTALRWGEQVHARCHGGAPDGCAFSATGFTECAWRDEARAATVLFSDWASAFFAELERVHLPPPAVRAAQIIDAHPEVPLNVDGIARAVGAHPAMLRRDFAARFGMTLRGYHVRARVMRGLELMPDRRLTMRMIADTLGYRSAKNFYRAFPTVTGKSVRELRRAARRPGY